MSKCVEQVCGKDSFYQKPFSLDESISFSRSIFFHHSKSFLLRGVAFLNPCGISFFRAAMIPFIGQRLSVKTCNTYPYNDEPCHSYIFVKEGPKCIWITWYTPWVLLTSVFLYRKWANFAISTNTDTNCILTHNF